MSKRRELVVERVYQPDEAACVGALECLLKKPVTKEAAAKVDHEETAEESRSGSA